MFDLHPFSIALSLLALVLCVPALVLFVECVASTLPARRGEPPRQGSSPPPPLADVLVPAHNEESVIGNTLQGLLAELGPEDRLWVIADNCTDQTATVARAAGARVIERNDTARLGKGFALEYAKQQIDDGIASVVVIVDADCTFVKGSFRHIVALADAKQRAIQSNYQMHTLDDEHHSRITQFAVRLKNFIRPLGLKRLGLPCLLTGSGMAFPWSLIRKLDLGNDNTADDLQTTCDILLAGPGPFFCEKSAVFAPLPIKEEARQLQRKRWIHGHFHTVLTYVGKLLRHAIYRVRLDVLALMIEMLVPPLSMFVLTWLAVLLASIGCGVLGLGWLPTGICLVAATLLLAGLGIAWAVHARQDFSIAEVVLIPAHVLRVVLICGAWFLHRQKWAPTERDGFSDNSGETAR